ncbi:MAG: hypothetical protein R3228_12985 [Halioglobus sp.]|nr:hypothetical protein [Halioglobus sp.]
MLDETSYTAALYVYAGAAILFVLVLATWLYRRWSPGWASLLVLLAAALLLTPAFPREGVATMAPALVVVGFALFTDGYDAAQHAIKPLATMCALAVALTVLLRFTLFRRRPGS